MPPAHPGEQHLAGREVVDGKCRHHRRVDLADADRRDHHVAPADRADFEPVPACVGLVTIGHRRTQQPQLTGKRRHDQYGTTHAASLADPAQLRRSQPTTTSAAKP